MSWWRLAVLWLLVFGTPLASAAQGAGGATPPQPNPLTWRVTPSIVIDGVYMEATPCIGGTGIEYLFFAFRNPGPDPISYPGTWQSSNTYLDIQEGAYSPKRFYQAWCRNSTGVMGAPTEVYPTPPEGIMWGPENRTPLVLETPTSAGPHTVRMKAIGITTFSPGQTGTAYGMPKSIAACYELQSEVSPTWVNCSVPFIGGETEGVNILATNIGTGDETASWCFRMKSFDAEGNASPLSNLGPGPGGSHCTTVLPSVAGQETLYWSEDQYSDVARFDVMSGTVSGTYTDTEFQGLPAPDISNLYSATFTVPTDGLTRYFAVYPWDAISFGPVSNEVSRVPATPPAAQAQVLGFVLWDAQADVVLDSNFIDGDTIPNANKDCVAIQIITNAYLNPPSASPGSLEKVLDSGVMVIENQFAYAWESGFSATQYDCASSLATLGAHTLVVTPYDGDELSGASGTPLSVSFTTLGP